MATKLPPNVTKALTDADAADGILEHMTDEEIELLIKETRNHRDRTDAEKRTKEKSIEDEIKRIQAGEEYKSWLSHARDRHKSYQLEDDAKDEIGRLVPSLAGGLQVKNELHQETRELFYTSVHIADLYFKNVSGYQMLFPLLQEAPTKRQKVA